MKKFDKFGELPKCDTETWSEQTLLEKISSIDLFNAGLPQPSICLKKKKKQYLWSTIRQDVPVPKRNENIC